jgi:hypothetical protein
MSGDERPSKLDRASGMAALVLLFILALLGVGDPPQLWAHKDAPRQVHAAKRSDKTSGPARFQ